MTIAAIANSATLISKRMIPIALISVSLCRSAARRWIIPMTISRAQIATCNTTAMVKTNWIACITTAGGFDAARRGQISHAETQALARDLGITAEDRKSVVSGTRESGRGDLGGRRIIKNKNKTKRTKTKNNKRTAQ